MESEIFYKVGDVDERLQSLMVQRTFRLWEAIITHSRVIFRSPVSKEHGWTTNIDILFTAVQYLQVASTLKGLRLEEASKSEVDVVHEQLDGALDGTVYALICGSRRYLVAAGACYVSENKFIDMMTGLRENI